MKRINLEARYEQDAQDCMAIRDTLDLVHNADYPRRSDASEYARLAEDLVDSIDEAFRSKLEPCHGCGDLDARVTFSVDLDWRISCPGCGRSVREETWSKAQDAWNGDGEDAWEGDGPDLMEEGDRWPSQPRTARPSAWH